MVSWNDVEEWDADGVAAVGDALVKARNAIVELEDELTDSASPEEWTGPSAESARQNLAKYRQDLETLVTEVAAMVATVDTVEDAVRQLRRDIDEAKGLAATHGFRIDDGRILEPEGEAGADTASVKSDLVERVDSILAKAKEVDTDLATMLDKVLADKISDEGATTLAQAAEVGEERVRLDRILEDYQVDPDPDGLVNFFGKTITKSEAELLDDIGLLGIKDMYDIQNKAFETAEERFEGQDSNDSHQDAFRHAYWNALMTQRFGEEWAEQYGTAHERLPGNPADREAMDLYNNEVGRKIAVDNPDADPKKLADLVEQAVKDGRMVVIDENGELAYSDDVAEGKTGRADDPAPEKEGGDVAGSHTSGGSGDNSGDYDWGS
jgi:ketosteroid isomerase-like protein